MPVHRWIGRGSEFVDHCLDVEILFYSHVTAQVVVIAHAFAHHRLPIVKIADAHAKSNWLLFLGQGAAYNIQQEITEMIVTVDELICYATNGGRIGCEGKALADGIVSEETIQQRGDESCT